MRVRRRYRGNTLILETEFATADGGVVVLIDFMPLREGRVADARRLFERLVGLCNDVGLLAEEFDIGAQRLVGDFPQAFSHAALLNAAHNVAHATKPCEQRFGNVRLREAVEWARDSLQGRPQALSAFASEARTGKSGQGRKRHSRADGVF